MHREMLVAVQVRRFARFEELGRDADAPFRRGSNLFELTWQVMERERGGESGSKKEMSHPRWTLAGNCVFNNGQSLLSIVRCDEQDRKLSQDTMLWVGDGQIHDNFFLLSCCPFASAETTVSSSENADVNVANVNSARNTVKKKLPNGI